MTRSGNNNNIAIKGLRSQFQCPSPQASMLHCGLPCLISIILNYLIFDILGVKDWRSISCAGRFVINVMYVRDRDTKITFFRYKWVEPTSNLRSRPTTLFDTTSLDRDYLHEVNLVSIQGRAHIANVGSSPLVSHYEKRIEPTTLHQTCQWEHALTGITCFLYTFWRNEVSTLSKVMFRIMWRSSFSCQIII